MNFLSVQVMADMESSIDSLITTFSTLFTACWNMISGNWFLLAGIGVPFVAGVLFSITSLFRNR